MKAKTLLVAAVMFFGLTAAAFAQATFQVGSIPVTAVTATGQTELTGSVTFSVVSGTTIGTPGDSATYGTITISYGVPITSALSGIAISAPAGSGFVASLPTVVTTASSNPAGVVVLSIPAGVATGSTFTVANVRVAVANTSLTTLSASISTVGNAIVAGQTTVTVISSIAAGIASVTSTAGSINAVSGAIALPTMEVKEGYLNAFNDSTYGGTGAGRGLFVRFKLSAAPPAGVNLIFPLNAGTVDNNTVASAGVFQLVSSSGTLATGTQTIKSSSSSLNVYYQLVTTSDPAKIETLLVTPNVTVDADATLPLPQVTITFTATLAPIGNAFADDGTVIAVAAGKAPRFVASEVGPATLLTISGSTTTMLVPFASTVSSSGYNTGIAVANTTTDPGTTAMAFTTAIKQSGKVIFYFYPLQVGSTAPTPFSYTTAAGSPGSGLDANGNLPSGSTYSVLLSQLLAAASAPADFSGYIFIVTQFTNGHCQYIITDFKAFANGGQAMIINANRTVTPEFLSH